MRGFDPRIQGTYIRRLGKWRDLTDCVLELEAQGYTIYKRGWPNVAAEKDGKMKFYVINPFAADNPTIMGKARDGLSEAFKRCYGEGFQIWNLKKKMNDPKRWI